jgi:hypothetical protein
LQQALFQAEDNPGATATHKPPVASGNGIEKQITPVTNRILRGSPIRLFVCSYASGEVISRILCDRHFNRKDGRYTKKKGKPGERPHRDKS